MNQLLGLNSLFMMVLWLSFESGMASLPGRWMQGGGAGLLAPLCLKWQGYLCDRMQTGVIYQRI